MEQLAERSLSAQENPGLNPFLSNFCKVHLLNVNFRSRKLYGNKEKEAGNDPFETIAGQLVNVQNAESVK